MRRTISKSELEQLTDMVNRILDTDKYVLSYAYGGVALDKICNDGGGVVDVFNSGHITKRDLHGRISAFIDGLFAMRRNHG